MSGKVVVVWPVSGGVEWSVNGECDWWSWCRVVWEWWSGVCGVNVHVRVENVWPVSVEVEFRR